MCQSTTRWQYTTHFKGDQEPRRLGAHKLPRLPALITILPELGGDLRRLFQCTLSVRSDAFSPTALNYSW